jgi:hypothetical protein
MQTDFGTYLPGTVDYETNPVPTTVVLNNSAPCDTYDYALTQVMAAIQNANITYDPFVYNSNAVVNTALGATVGQGHYPAPPVWAPGWGTTLPLGPAGGSSGSW